MKGDLHVLTNVLAARSEAKEKAIDSLSRYKFEMFGYWASAWVKYNQLLPAEQRESNPFRELVLHARSIKSLGGQHVHVVEVDGNFIAISDSERKAKDLAKTNIRAFVGDKYILDQEGGVITYQGTEDPASVVRIFHVPVAH